MFDYTKNPTIVTESLMIAGGGGGWGRKRVERKAEPSCSYYL